MLASTPGYKTIDVPAMSLHVAPSVDCCHFVTLPVCPESVKLPASLLSQTVLLPIIVPASGGGFAVSVALNEAATQGVAWPVVVMV